MHVSITTTDYNALINALANVEIDPIESITITGFPGLCHARSFVSFFPAYYRAKVKTTGNDATCGYSVVFSLDSDYKNKYNRRKKIATGIITLLSNYNSQ